VITGSTPWGTSVIFEVSSAAPDADPVWVDLSDRVLDIGQGLDIGEGRQTELSDVDPGVFTVQLNNRDDALTSGNPTSPYPWWKSGRRCRFREIVGWLGFDLHDGYLEIPENLVRTQEPNATDSDILLTVTGVDLVGRHRNSRVFVSTLGEHILLHGGSALVGYWPLNEANGPDVNAEVGGPWTLTEVQHNFGPGSGPDASPASITYGSATVAPADDAPAVTFDPALANDALTEFDVWRYLLGTRTTSITLGPGQVVTVVCWTRWNRVIDAPSVSRVATIAALTNSSNPGDIYASIDLQGSTLQGQGGNQADWFGGVNGPDFVLDHPVPVAVRVGFNPSTIELWVRGEVYTDTMTINSATNASFNQVQVGRGYPGAVSHVQVYVGAPDDWDHDDFLAQRDMGLFGLERQSTGERVNTVADYAGIPAAQRDIDPGESVMQVARLAGKTAAQAWDEARDTEQGRLFAHAGRLTFHDRARIYNV
jgi:hypothetical protein